MKYLVTVLLTASVIGTILSSGYNALVVKYTGAKLEELAALKQECEAKLPRNKVCEMYFEYLPERE